MAKATRVLSTPRTTASKIQSKKRAKPVENEEQRNLRHAEAFHDLETPVRELYLMGEIAADIATGMHEDQRELMHFSINNLCEMVRDFRTKYRADLHAGPDRGKAVA
jgi:hypothetical protein